MINPTGNIPLFNAITMGQYEEIDRILSVGEYDIRKREEYPETFLSFIFSKHFWHINPDSYEKFPEMIKVLLKHGANPLDKDNDHGDAIMELNNNGRIPAPIKQSIKSIFAQFLDKQIDISLAIRLELELPKIKDILLKNINDINKLDKLGYAPIHYALGQHGKIGRNILQLLIKNKADVNVQATKEYFSVTPLVIAVCTDNISAISTLLRSGADPNINSSDDVSALMYAVESLSLIKMGVIEMLVDNGTDIQARDNAGNDALTYLERTKFKKSVKEKYKQFFKEKILEQQLVALQKNTDNTGFSI